jgi:glucose-6-phosphate isomerase
MEVNLKDKKPNIRHLNEMLEVIYDKTWGKNAPNLELYYVYRKIKEKGDLRYDITIIPPKMLGEEFVRTKGNRNSEGYQELYTVLEGEAIFFMQKTKDKTVKDVFVVKVKAGEWIIVPPDYTVITINPSDRILKTGNWVSEKTQNIYEEIEKMKGGCYYYTKSGWVKNKNYEKTPELRFEKPLKSIPKNIDFLKNPEIK